LALYYIGNNDTTLAQYILDSVLVQFDLSNSELSRHQDYTDYVGILTQLTHSNYDIFCLDFTQKQYLYILAQKEHIIGAYARNILQFADTLTYNEPIIWPSFLKTLEFKEPDNMHNYTDSRLKVYPNPANTYIIIEWNLLSLTDAIINIYDMNGQVLESIQPNNYHSYSILNTKKYSSGIYLCRISNGDGIQETVKFVINH
jgi:hypothetical protein